MNWQIKLTDKAKKDLKKLTKDNKKQALKIAKRFIDCETDPFLYFEPMKYESSGKYKMRVGDYRVIAILEESIKIVSVEKIRHRKNSYQ